MPFETLPHYPTIGAMLHVDRKSAERADQKWVEAQCNRPEARFFVLINLKPILASGANRSTTEIRWFNPAERADLGLGEYDVLFLGIDGQDRPHFSIAMSENDAKQLPRGVEQFEPLVEFRSLAMQGIMAAEELSFIATARSLATWHQTHRCCGRCGAHTKPRDGGWRRKCWACDQSAFPRSDPAVIMLITDGERCLLGHEERFLENVMSVLAGFVEPGEAIEDAVRREVMEEAGIEVGKVSYLASQPWPFPHSLMIGCVGEALTTEIKLEDSELVHALWADRAEVGRMLASEHEDGLRVPANISISHMLIRSFAEGLA
ncbi:NADH pyrophosphatase [bacterium MnTg02]|nr:NADH pyrophosphatase [bacterium MnTg02]